MTTKFSQRATTKFPPHACARRKFCGVFGSVDTGTCTIPGHLVRHYLTLDTPVSGPIVVPTRSHSTIINSAKMLGSRIITIVFALPPGVRSDSTAIPKKERCGACFFVPSPALCMAFKDQQKQGTPLCFASLLFLSRCVPDLFSAWQIFAANHETH